MTTFIIGMWVGAVIGVATCLVTVSILRGRR